jgi:allantoicase
VSSNGEADAQSDWFPLLDAVDLGANRHHVFALDTARTCTHVRVNLFPDGGLARLKILGTPDVAAARVDANGWVDLASALNGARALTANNEHFGCAANLLLPGRGRDMGDGWETRRRREPGNDWCIIALADTGIIEAIEVDTAHFKGNFPGALFHPGRPGRLPRRAIPSSRARCSGPSVLDEQPLRMDAEHRFRAEIKAHAPVSHVRLNIFPDGGVSRLRLFGRRA